MDTFDLSVVTLAAAADAAGLQAFENLHVEMLTWHSAGVFPAAADVTAALKAGYATSPRVVASAATLAQYASGIVKWAKAGRTPSAHTMRAFMQPVPGAKSAKGRKAKAKAADADTPKVAPESRVDVREGAIVALQGMMAARAKLVPPAAVSEFENALTTCMMLLRQQPAPAAAS